MSNTKTLKVTLLFENSKEEYRGFYEEDKIKRKEVHIRETIRKAIEERNVTEFHLEGSRGEEYVVVDGKNLIGFSTIITYT